MGRINLGIADKDGEYSSRLADCLLQNYGGVFNITVFSAKEDLNGALARREDFLDVLLIDETIYESISADKKEKPPTPFTVILLSEDLKPKSPGTVCKYRHVNHISRDIISAYYEHGGKKTYPSSSETNTRLIGISSASGGAGKSTFSACLAVQCAIRGYSVLFVSLEEIPSTSHFFKEDYYNKGLSYVFYKIKSGELDVSAAIESCAAMSGREGLCFMPAPENPLEYGEISAEELDGMLRDMRNLGKYDYIFIDMQSGYSLKTEMTKKQCDVVFMLLGDSALSAVKSKEIIKALNEAKSRGGSDMQDKIIPVLSFNSGGYSSFENIEFNEKNICDRLPYEPGFLQSAGIEQFYNPSNQYVSAVAEILRKYIISTGKILKQGEFI